ncbi:MAG: ImmA/IrrE family metallo-endopeptidase [Alphaproteobacteria bacterium]|nr:ImmA/IrrE family metallo-endopeptidase [Alphaproteobacteria bacterium]MDE2495926.1 ImmA/IrrE family metallo-endopeptidase [Alphaproteobacteria bacterium]
MPRRSPYDFATEFAEKLLRAEFGVDKLPIDPIALARSKGIHVQAMPRDHDGVSGMFIHAYGKSAIAYATNIGSKGFQNFSVAHEIGHCYLPGHIDAVLPNGATEHFSHSGFVSDDRYELEADHFAAGFLMPSRLFTSAMNTSGEGLDAVVNMSGRCNTSLIATAIRFQQLTHEAVAVVQSCGDLIDFCFMSDRMLELKPRRWPRKGEPLSRASATYTFNRNPARVECSERTSAETDGDAWFGGLICDIELFEETIGLGSYGRTLTIITTVDALDDDEEDAADDDWTPRFR